MMRWKIAQFFERKWWQRYMKNKDSVEYLHWKKDYWRGLIADFNYEPGDFKGPILDVGCGPAGIFTIFAEAETVGVDPLIESYVEDGILVKEDYPRVKFISKAYEDYQPTIKYRTVFCLNAINHFKDIDFSFKHLREMTEINGTIFLSIDAHKYRFLKRVFAFLQFDILHPHQYTLEEYEEFLRVNRLEVVNKHLKEKHSMFDYWVLELRRI